MKLCRHLIAFISTYKIVKMGQNSCVVVNFDVNLSEINQTGENKDVEADCIKEFVYIYGFACIHGITVQKCMTLCIYYRSHTATEYC